MSFFSKIKSFETKKDTLVSSHRSKSIFEKVGSYAGKVASILGLAVASSAAAAPTVPHADKNISESVVLRENTTSLQQSNDPVLLASLDLKTSDHLSFRKHLPSPLSSSPKAPSSSLELKTSTTLDSLDSLERSKLSVPIENFRISADLFLAGVTNTKGTRYKWGGKSASRLDCSGMVTRALEQAAKEFGINNITYKGINVKHAMSSHDLRDYSKPILLDEVKAGDLLFSQPKKGPHHVVVVTGPITEDGRIPTIGASSSAGKVVPQYWSTQSDGSSKWLQAARPLFLDDFNGIDIAAYSKKNDKVSVLKKTQIASHAPKATPSKPSPRQHLVSAVSRTSTMAHTIGTKVGSLVDSILRFKNKPIDNDYLGPIASKTKNLAIARNERIDAEIQKLILLTRNIARLEKEIEFNHQERMQKGFNLSRFNDLRAHLETQRQIKTHVEAKLDAAKLQYS